MSIKKKGIDYYQHFIGMTNDEKLSGLRMEYGSVAIDVWLTLYDLIYGGNGYYIEYGDEKTRKGVVWKILGIVRGKYSPTPETISNIIEDLVACELFSGDRFKSGILTSKRIQKQFYQATVERKVVEINPEHWLLNLEEMKKLSLKNAILRYFENRPNSEENRPIMCENRSEKEQSRVEKSRVEKSRDNMTDKPSPPCSKSECESIFDLYNTICVSYPKLTARSAARIKAIKARLNSGYTTEDFKRLFEKAEASSFLKGKNDRNWSATFDWLIADKNMAKVLDGNYEDKKSETDQTSFGHDLNEYKSLVNNFGD